MKEKFDELIDFNTNIPCVYFLLNDDELLYIGKTDNIGRRLYQHKRGNWFVFPKEFNRVLFIESDDATFRHNLELNLIHEFQPKYNDLQTELPDIPIEVLISEFKKVKW